MVESLGVAREVCTRLPLAEATLRLLDAVTQEDFLHEVFDRYRGRSYEKEISFPTFVALIADALLGHQGSARQSFRRAQEGGDLTATHEAAYGKLRRVPLGLSKGFLFEASRHLLALFPDAARTPVPASLAGMHLTAVDGKKVKHVAKRMKATRDVLGQLYGGKLVVALSVDTRLAVALDADPDGEASDTPLLPGVVGQVRERIAGPILWVADRLFCDLDQPALLGQRGDHYVLRYNARVSFHPDAARGRREGTNGKGQRYVEEWGWLGTAKDARRRYVRRITLSRPGDPGGDVALVTDLLDAEEYPAEDILDAYLLRWEIENCFQQVTEVFALRRLICGTPEATVYQAMFCLLLYDVLTVARGYVAEAAHERAEDVSLEELFKDAQRQLVAWNEVVSVEETVALLAGYPAEDLPGRLRGLAAGLWKERWRKTKGSGKPGRLPRNRPKEYPKGGHTSVYRLLQRARQATKHSPSP
jgi:Transposase DDE domain